MWLISLVLSITSALLATSLQQWARRYIQIPQVPSLASERARVRSFLFLGTVKYDISLAVETAPTLLHFSVFLFFTGLVIFFFTIHKATAIAVSVAVGIFAVIYLMLTIVPYFDYKCPYRTPMSDLWWYPWNAFLSLAAICLYWLVELCLSCLMSDDVGQQQGTPPGRAKLVGWSGICEGAYNKYWGHFRNSFEKRIIEEALDAPVDMDRDALTRLFGQLALAERTELLKFVAQIPRDEFIHIMTPPFEFGRIIFREPLLTLIESCAVDTNIHGLDENERKNCLLVWLAAVLHITKYFFSPDQTPETGVERLLDDVLINFADSSRMKAMCAHTDSAIRFTSRLICALLAKWLVQNNRFYFEELRWLEVITGIPREEISNFGDHRRILDFLVCGVFPHTDGDLLYQGVDIPNLPGSFPPQEDYAPNQADDIPTAITSSFVESLAILLDADTQPPFDDLTRRLSDIVRQMRVGEPHSRFVAENLRRMFLDCILAL